MNSLSLTPFSSATCTTTPTLPKLKPLFTLHHHHHPHHSYTNFNQKQRITRKGRCRAALAHEAPFVVAIGACVLNSLAFPLPVGPHDEEDGDSVIDSADARFAVMGIISFIPYFNWMSWVFAWMDTGDKRYALYAIVYLAPYLRAFSRTIMVLIVTACDCRTNLSISPDESWLPIASILLCIIHIQLEASIKNGDLQLFNGALRNTSSKKDDKISEQGTRKDEQSLPSPHLRNNIRNWGIPKKPAQQADHHLNEEEEEEKKH
ncbi:hypothetical protein OSB04_022216 [Centaurea solstitialis]|uniref:Uncharacterized protein n=1 Tax=Centaurea solstitialis TaxID=347529 RepID=A0AA38SVY6_9ASTR|nr:hypothetical protein OSB04_022216 [Centaurea solstitialis]